MLEVWKSLGRGMKKCWGVGGGGDISVGGGVWNCWKRNG